GSNLAGRVRGEIVALFNPRRQKWSRHFRWQGAVLVGRTKCGRATVRVLNINADDHVALRKVLMAAGSFAPDEGPRQRAYSWLPRHCYFVLMRSRPQQKSARSQDPGPSVTAISDRKPGPPPIGESKSSGYRSRLRPETACP